MVKASQWKHYNKIKTNVPNCSVFTALLHLALALFHHHGGHDKWTTALFSLCSVLITLEICSHWRMVWNGSLMRPWLKSWLTWTDKPGSHLAAINVIWPTVDWYIILQTFTFTFGFSVSIVDTRESEILHYMWRLKKKRKE